MTVCFWQNFMRTSQNFPLMAENDNESILIACLQYKHIVMYCSTYIPRISYCVAQSVYLGFILLR